MALLILTNLTFAQTGSSSKRKLLQESLPPGLALSTRAPAHLAASSGVVPPPNTSDSWTGGGDGTSWNNAANWSAGVPNGSTVDVTIGTTTASVNDNLVNAQVANLTLSHAGDSLTVANGIALLVFGPNIRNAGTITLGSAGSGTDLELEGNVSLSGAGTLMMSNNSNNFIFGAASSDTLTNQSTIQGAGFIGHGQMGLVNSGTINANQTAALTIQANGTGAGATNTGTMEATAGGTLALFSTTFNNTGGTISANGSTLQVIGSIINGGAVTLTGASKLLLSGGTIHGGSTLTNSATGTIEVGVSSIGSTLGGTINNSAGGTVKIDNGAGLILEAGTYSKLGAVQMNSAGSNTNLELLGNVTLSGGTVTMSNSANNFIFGNPGTSVLTNQETIQGAGNIGNGQMGLINSGTIIANQSAGLIIQPSSSGFTNSGTLQVSNGVLMHVTGGPFTNFSGSTLTGGTYNVSGTLQIDELGTTGGEIVTNAAKIILNGASSSFVDQANKDVLTNLNSNAATGAFTVSGGRKFTTAGNFNNLGSLTVGTGSAFTVTGTLAQISGSTLSGGTFVLGGNLNVGSGINITTNSSTLTLQGGTIMSGATNALAGLNKNTKTLTLANNANFTTTGNFTNSGTMTVNSGSTFAVTGNLTNYNSTSKTLTGGIFTVGGTLSASGLDIQTDAANITLNGTGKFLNSTTSANGLANLNTIAGTGSLTLATNANFTAAGNFTDSGKLTINSGSTFGVTGTLTNLSAGTLTGGTYTVGGTLQLTAANGGITTNAANLTLTGSTAKIQDGASNALSTFNNNTGTFALSTGAKLTTAASNFTNSGTVTVAKGTTFTVGGTGKSYNQSAGTTTVDGTLAGGGATGVSVTGGTMQGAGTLKTNVSLGGGTMHVGDAAKAGLLNITGTYTQLSAGTMNVSIGGTAAGTQASQLKVSGAASLGGTLTAALVNGFTPVVGQSFIILTAASVTGTFTNSTIAINGSEHFNVTYTATNVTLTVASGPSKINSATATASQVAVAAMKPASVAAKLPPAISSLRHRIGVPVKVGRPIFVAALHRGGGPSNAMRGRVWDGDRLQTPHALPVLSVGIQTSERPTQVSRIASDHVMRPSVPVSNHWMGGSGLRVSPTPGRIGMLTRRPAMPVRILPAHIPIMAPVR